MAPILDVVLIASFLNKEPIPGDHGIYLGPDPRAFGASTKEARTVLCSWCSPDCNTWRVYLALRVYVTRRATEFGTTTGVEVPRVEP